ncbi:acyltransferase family protein [Haemophilus haemolyticus]|uniref:acyltransferase family protein n=1 Tax=Haemophilus haemolyticus TaxID=726 RepID=UPI00062D5F88|nr:acyltransferase family protein [Haemophilus haemolyticus]KKZ53360.1 hypothetical protein AAX15_07840 [Haemophilus haemolyticus]
MKKRNIFLDIVKGLAIFLMVFGHCIQNGSGVDVLNKGMFWNFSVFQFIYSFHMPLFMIVSGYFVFFSQEKYDLILIVKNRLKRIFIPLLLFSVYSYLYLNSIYKNGNVNIYIDFNDLIYKIFHSYWFLWGILISSILVSFIHKLLKGSIFIHLTIVLLFILFAKGYILKMTAFIYPFFLIGYLLAKYRVVLFEIAGKYYSQITLACSVSFVSIFLFWDINSYIYHSGVSILNPDLGFSTSKQFFIDVYRIIIGVLGSASFVLVSYIIYNNTKKLSSIVKVFWSVLAYLGENSLGIYCIQELLIVFGLRKMSLNNTDNYFVNLIQAILILILCAIIIKTLKMNKNIKKLHLG